MRYTKVRSLVTATTYESSIERASKRLTEAPICHPLSVWPTGSSLYHSDPGSQFKSDIWKKCIGLWVILLWVNHTQQCTLKYKYFIEINAIQEIFIQQTWNNIHQLSNYGHQVSTRMKHWPRFPYYFLPLKTYRLWNRKIIRFWSLSVIISSKQIVNISSFSLYCSYPSLAYFS